MASGEPIEARLPYGEPFTINEYAKLIFNCNTLPKEVEHTNAFFRRFLIIGFDVTIPEDKQDKELAKKIIQNELSGVFNWILEGLQRLMKQKNFSKCEAIEKARQNYMKESDSVQTFLDDNGYKIDVNEYTAVKELYSYYRMFCIEDGFKPVNKSNFMKRLRHHKVLVERKSNGFVAYVKTELRY
jgi:putative DNA primase/helicase